MNLSLLFASCVTPNDNGDEAFAASAVEAVLGRKPLGSSEVRALADFAAANGRDAMVDVLFEQPEYVSYWSNVLADALEVQRTGGMAVAPDCLGRPLVPPEWSAQLARHLAEADPNGSFCVDKLPTPTAVAPHLAASYELALGVADEEYAFTPVSKIATSEQIAPVDTTVLFKDDLPPLYGPGAPFGDLPPINPFVLFDLPRPSWEDWFLQTDEPPVRDWDLPDDYVAPCYTFNLTDALQAAVRGDRLDAVFRAYLPVLTSTVGGEVDGAAEFLSGVLGRRPDCMACHTSTYSTTNPLPRNGNWDRFFPPLTSASAIVDLEGSLFSTVLPTGEILYGGGGGTQVVVGINVVLGEANHAKQGGIRPFGMSGACVTNVDPTKELDANGNGIPDGPTTFDGFPLQTAATIDPAFAGLPPGAGVLALINAYRDGVQSPTPASLAVPDWASHRAFKGASSAPPTPNCSSCHPSAPLAPDLASVAPAMTDARLFEIIRYGVGRMPSVAADDRAAWDAVQWVRNSYPSNPALEFVDRERALVALVAAHLVNRVVDEVMGEDLVMAHGFPRNADQALVLFNLTATLLDGHSLRAVLKQIVLSDWFSRRPPEDPASSGYALPLVLEPAVALHPTATATPESVGNSEGDLVHRHSTAGLLLQVSAALGWPAPLPGGHPTGVYPDQALATSLGRYSNSIQPEHQEVNTSGLMAWARTFETCDKPSAVFARDVHTVKTFLPDEVVNEADWEDWIDLVVADMQAQGFGWRELAERIQDRLLADATLSAAEVNALAVLWKEDLSTLPAAGTTAAEIEERAREYCGVLLGSPQFLLQGVREGGLLTEIDNTCMPGEPCSTADRLAAFEATWKAIVP